MTDPAGFKTFADDVVLTASEINGYLMQGILVFDDSSARDTALSGSLAEGRYCYLKDTNTTYVYTGSSWEAVTGSSSPTVSGTTGSPSTGTGKAGRDMYTWTGNGSITFSVAGTIRLLVVSGGRGGTGSTVNSGGGGGVVDLVDFWVEAGAYTVTVGAAGVYNTATGAGNGGTSSFAKSPLTAQAAAAAVGSNNVGNANNSANSIGVLTDISGSSVGYGGAGWSSTNTANYDSTYGGALQATTPARANSGGGGNEVGPSGDGAAGCVIVLV